jgi:hypothetical protein
MLSSIALREKGEKVCNKLEKHIIEKLGNIVIFATWQKQICLNLGY